MHGVGSGSLGFTGTGTAFGVKMVPSQNREDPIIEPKIL